MIKVRDLHTADDFAFPSHGSMGEVVARGMTLRDYFAAKAMQGFVINRDLPSEPTSAYFDHIDIVAVADGAYRMADAMLKARAQ